MSTTARLPIVLLSLALCAGSLTATSYVPMTDSALAGESPLIIQGKIEARNNDVDGNLPITNYTVQIEKVLQGYAPGSALIVRVPGGVRPDGIGLKLFGAPHFTQGEETILFLSQAQDSTYRIVQFMLGAFHRVRDGIHWDAVRDLSQASPVAVKQGATSPPTVRDFDRFSKWLADRALGSLRAEDYLVPTTTSKLKSLTAPFVLMTSSGCPQTLPLRWFVFDSGGSESFETVGQVAGMSDGGNTEFQQALAAWTNDSNSDVRYIYGGTANGDTGLSGSSDNQNAIKFDDPDNEISGSFNCTSGGTLAIGGPWFTCSVQQYLGASYHPILEGDIVTQDNAGCFFSGHGGADGAEVFTHELGHTLGLGHSTVSGAIMRAYAYGDGRGASLGSDDLAAIRCLYGDGTTCSVPASSPPTAPTGLGASALSSTSIYLSWLDNSSNESSFRIEDHTPSSSYIQVATTNSNVTGTTVGGLSPQTTYTFRVRACNSSGCSAYSNEASATTSGSPSSALQAPSNLQASDVNSTQVALHWQNNDSGQQNVAIEEAVGASGSFAQVAAVAGSVSSWTATSLSPATEYRFRVRAESSSSISQYSNIATAVTAANACGDPNALCLLQGRFAVTVHWVDPANNRSGAGTPVASTDQSGLFWFFTPENFELAVKMVDGRSLNGHFWVFYGGLSNVEYDLTVLDRDSGETRVYHNPWKTICGGSDTEAFPLSAASTTVRPLSSGSFTSSSAMQGTGPDISMPATGGACIANGTTLCLQQDRFAVRVRFIDPNTNAPGNGIAIPQSDESGLFWFFSPNNFELAVKIHDGRSLNGHFWVFYGALSTVHYEITVSDTATGLSHTFINPQGNICGGATTSLF